jgi:membrane-bound lytic murein transglycosylase A
LYTTRETPLLTAYYTPTIQVSERRNGAYQFPIFGLPPDGLRRITRNDIDFKNALAGRGLELYYARDRFDAYLLHVEGGGRVLVQDSSGTKPGKSRYLSYAGNNGLSLRLLEEYMVRHGMLHATDVSRHAQRQYLNAHPQFAEQILSSSPGYVYFRQSQESPEGNAGVPLTPGRSLALDPVHYPATGLVAFVVAPQPIPPGHGVPPESNPRNLRFRTLSRFFVAQDEGPYIRGAARFDLYFGEDDNALFLANNFRTAGKVFFLMLR